MTRRRRNTSSTYTPGAGADDRAYRKARARFRAKCEAYAVPCHLCGQNVDYSENSSDPWELDHFYPRSLRPELALDPGNFRSSHRRCNRARGSKDVRPTLGNPSREW